MSTPDPTPFEIDTVRRADRLVVSVRGELDLATTPQLEAVLARESAKGGTLVLDLTGLRFIDSSGIRVLLLAWQGSQRDGFELRLTRSTDVVMKAFALVGVMDELPFLDEG